MVIGTAGGVGTSTIARARARDDGALLIEGSNRMRVQDLLAEERPDQIYDYYDFLTGSGDDAVIHLESYDLIQGSIFHDLEEVEEERFKERIASLSYDEIVVDLSRHRDADLIYWGALADTVYLVSDGSKASIREMERIRFTFQRHRLMPRVVAIFNRLKEGEKERIEEEVDFPIEDVYYIEESAHPDFSIKNEKSRIEEKEASKKKSFWDFFKPKNRQ
ncbi:MAG: hypothetical protein SPI65_00640 [Peptoniphilus sp.]|nr:hypothetical protein [Peptoniphilus sp.]MDD7363682.1 hypothetical protein [Bacillota bacterium]MDY6044067.1 hypothetical protein [Peptoniphilus sp.]